MTTEQRAFWDEVGWPRERPQANAGQTTEQALTFVVHQIRYAYHLDGHDVPSAIEVEAELS